jgi:hypothetical protein
VVNASAMSRSIAGADAASSPANPMSRAPTARSTPSIVRRFRRPGSIGVSNEMFKERAAERACSARFATATSEALGERSPGSVGSRHVSPRWFSGERTPIVSTRVASERIALSSA